MLEAVTEQAAVDPGVVDPTEWRAMNCARDLPELADLPDGGDPPGEGALPLAVLAARLCTGAVAISAATAAWLVLVAEFDRRRGWAVPGVLSCAHWLSWQCGLGPGAAREHVRVARALAVLPLIAAQFAAGSLSYAKVRAVTRVAEPGTQEALLAVAEHGTAAQVERAVAGWRRAAGQTNRDAAESAERAAERAVAAAAEAGADPDAVAEAGRAAAAAEWAARWAEGADHPELTDEVRKRFEWSDDGNGMVSIRLRLTAEGAAEMINEVEHRTEVQLRRERAAATRAANAAAAGQDSGDVTETPDEDTDVDVEAAGDDREQAERRRRRVTSARCDALLELVRIGAADADRSAGDPPRREALIRLDAAVLAEDLAAGQAALDGIAALTPAQARRLACDAALTVVLTDGEQVLACGRTRRYATRAQRRALLVRDGGCARPGCTETRIERLHAHHRIHWLRGGKTDLANLVLLCDRDHGLVHDLDLMLYRESGRLIAHATDGTPVWAEHDASTDVSTADLDTGTDPADLPPYWRANGERMQLAHTVSVLLAHRAHLRRHEAVASAA